MAILYKQTELGELGAPAADASGVQRTPWGETMAPPPAAPPVFEVAPVGESQNQSQAPPRARRRWLPMAVVAAVGVVAAAVLAVLLFNTSGQLSKLTRTQAATQGQLTTTRSGLSRAHQDIAARQSLQSYLKMYFTDEAHVLQDQARLSNDCAAKLPTCLDDLTSIQSDFQTFENDRSSISAPPLVKAADAQLGTALTQSITAFRQLSMAQNTADLTDAEAKLRAADAAFATAVTEVGAALGTQSSPV